MLDSLLYPLSFPAYSNLKHFEGKGNYAVTKYYKWPWRFFYRHKLKMIVKALGPKLYDNILDYGAGPGIFTKELQKHCVVVKSINENDVIDSRWRFGAVVCASSLEFLPLSHHLKLIKSIMKPKGVLIVASPIDNRITDFYFKHIRDLNRRHSHETIVNEVSKHFTITEHKIWLGLYFCLKAVPKQQTP